MSKLGDILQKEAHREINAIESGAESQAKRLLSDAEEKASARVKSHQKKMQAEALAATRRARSAAELHLTTARMQARGEAIESVRKKVLKGFEKIANQPDYRHILMTLAEEALKAVEGANAVVVHPDDEEKIREWATQKRLELRADARLRLGVRIADTSGKRSVENSLPERLDRAWNTLAFEVAKQLWE
jgi:V/A-type H+-transporting ATPase subunit E